MVEELFYEQLKSRTNVFWQMPCPPFLSFSLCGALHPLLEKVMAPYSSTLAWKIPWMEEPGRLQSVGSRRVGHDWATSLSLFTFMHWKRKWQPTPVFLPGKSQGWGSLVAAIYGVAQSRTRLKQLSSSSSSISEPVYTCPTLPLHQGHYMAFNFVCQRINTLHN